jgi:hypothetical protein
MAASAFDYEQGVSNQMFQDAAGAGQNQYQRFLRNRQYQRDSGDAARSFRQSQPRFGAGYAQRNMLNSGIYRGDMQERFRGYQDYQNRLSEGNMIDQSQLANNQAMTDQNRYQTLLNLFEKFQADRAAEDPFAQLLNPFQGVQY